MAYQMIYGSGRTTIPNNKPLRRQTMIAVCFLFFSLLVRTFWDQGAQVLREFLLPGDLTVTEAAFAKLLDDLQQGSAFTTAVEVFCHRVIHG